MAENFTAKQKEIVARKLGYDGPMQGFDDFISSSPSLDEIFMQTAPREVSIGLVRAHTLVISGPEELSSLPHEANNPAPTTTARSNPVIFDFFIVCLSVIA